MDRSPALLLKAAAAGDPKAWHQIVDDYNRLVWSVARGFRLSLADAADVSQTTWLRLVENLDRIQNPDQLAGWLATTARREALRLIHKTRREVPDSEETEDKTPFFSDSDDDGDPETALVAEQDRTDLWQAFSTLSERCRNLLRVVAVTPLESYTAVAQALGMPIGSIGPTRSRCLEQLKRALKAVTSVPERAG
ncbi:sigma-70 family RNA polymerase sigma factor [Catenulispora sp. NF23]|uniref:RNA polymerase sigma factor n=1 Tax=Catenulispora pinistramenti TaxID=2705254 RepID=UPI001BA758BF|nr:sigma-70 family RNA polymerase sigma factor [Catenulispora pinistramenti]MBS2532957.1 sigma-70 family RNA polymerase sigma factor [Catenulispora pinistramenti]